MLINPKRRSLVLGSFAMIPCAAFGDSQKTPPAVDRNKGKIHAVLNDGPVAALRRSAYVDVRDYGALADGKRITDATISLASPKTVISRSNPFTSADIGKRIFVWGAGAGTDSLVATISSYNGPGSVGINTAASTAVSGVEAHYGTDNNTAFQNAVTRLLALGGGIFRAVGTFMICHGADGAAASQHNCAFPSCSNIDFDFSRMTLLGTMSLNTSAGANTIKNKNINVIGGTIRAVGDRIDPMAGSTTWNLLTCIYGENITIGGGIKFYVPPGARSVSLQSDNNVGTDTVKLRNCGLNGFQVIGPDDPALRHLSDGVDLLTAGADNIWQSLFVKNGTAVNVGRGFVTQNSGGHTNRDLTIENFEVINPYQVGSVIFDVTGLRGAIKISGLRSHGSYPYKGHGVPMNNCDDVSFGIDVIGADVAGLGTAITIGNTSSSNKRYVLKYANVSTVGAANKFTLGFNHNADNLIANNVTLANCTTGIDSGLSHTGKFVNLITRNCTTPIGKQTASDIAAGKIALLGYQNFKAS